MRYFRTAEQYAAGRVALFDGACGLKRAGDVPDITAEGYHAERAAVFRYFVGGVLEGKFMHLQSFMLFVELIEEPYRKILVYVFGIDGRQQYVHGGRFDGAKRSAGMSVHRPSFRTAK